MLPRLNCFRPGDRDLTDTAFIQGEKDRFVPFSLSPFRQPGSSQQEEAQSKPPAWFELSGDLVWTASFSSLTSNTNVTTPGTIANYAVFFVLLWPLWATQTTYDLKYSTDDWWHRIFFVLQLSVYAALASFSGSFEVFWHISATDEEPANHRRSPPRLSPANPEYTMAMACKGVNLTLMLSRILLLVQYARVHYYRRRTQWARQDLIVPASLALAGMTFFISFLIIDIVPPSRGMAIFQIVLWAIAVLAQLVGDASRPDEPEGSLRSEEDILPRLGSLTVVILGEGVNGFCSTFHTTFGAPIGNLSPFSFIEAFSMGVILYFLWLLYFDGHQIRSRSKRAQRYLTWLHLPFHLSVILMLEGIKNAYLYTAMEQAIQSFSKATMDYISTGVITNLPLLQQVSLAMGRPWENVLKSWNAANKTHPGVNGEQLPGDITRQLIWFQGCINGIATIYQGQMDQYFSSAAQPVDGILPGGNLTSLYSFQETLDQTGNLSKPLEWLNITAGFTVLTLGLMMGIPRRGMDGYLLGYQLIQCVLGVSLVLAPSRFLILRHYDPILHIAIVLALAKLLDGLVLYRSVRSIKEKEQMFQEGELDENAMRDAGLTERPVESYPLLPRDGSEDDPSDG